MQTILLLGVEGCCFVDHRDDLVLSTNLCVC